MLADPCLTDADLERGGVDTAALSLHRDILSALEEADQLLQSPMPYSCPPEDDEDSVA